MKIGLHGEITTEIFVNGRWYQLHLRPIMECPGPQTNRRRGPVPTQPEPVRTEMAGRYLLNNEALAELGRQYGVDPKTVKRVGEQFRHGPRRMEALRAAGEFHRRHSDPGLNPGSTTRSGSIPVLDPTTKARKRASVSTLDTLNTDDNDHW